MSSEPQEGSVREQLSSAEGTIVQNEEELCRQRRLLHSSWNPELQLHIAVLPQHWMKENEDLYNQQRDFSVKQEEPEPPQIKEELLEPEPPQIKEEPEEPEPPQIKEEPEEPEPPQIKEELQEPEPPQIKEEPGELCISHTSAERDRILGEKPSVQPVELLDSCFVQEEESPGPAAVAASLASRSCGDTDTGDGILVAPLPSTSDESSAATSEDTSSVNSHASSTSTASTTAKCRKRKSKMDATLEAFADKIISALKQDETDLLLKMQAAQNEHHRKMLAMMTQFMERSIQPPQPPLYQAPVHPSHVYSSFHSPTPPSTRFPVASSPSPTPPLPFFQDLNQ